jgi:hypothetical protein
MALGAYGAHPVRHQREAATLAPAPAEWVAGAAWGGEPAETMTANTTQTIAAATAHMIFVKRRFIRPQSANSNGFIVLGITLRLIATRPG